MERITPRLIDVKEICSRLPDAVDELIDYEGHESLLADLKHIQGSHGRGIRHMDRIVPALKLVDHFDLALITALRLDSLSKYIWKRMPTQSCRLHGFPCERKRVFWVLIRKDTGTAEDLGAIESTLRGLAGAAPPVVTLDAL
eukprot:2815168-Lingulodinium_polyedra.AAC.1